MSRADWEENGEYIISMGDGADTEWVFRTHDAVDGIIIEHSYGPETEYMAEVAISVPTLISWLRRSGRLT